MKYLFILAISFMLFTSCDTIENKYSEINPVGASKIENITINGNQVKVTTSYGTPTPCWYYYKTESQNFRDTFISKVFAKYDGEMCIQITGSFNHEETVLFAGSGNKTLRFWQNDSTYLDTTITLQ
ncbi:MAG: hypothetical protein R6W68_00975 [Ignavibacteriaceae bacterium]